MQLGGIICVRGELSPEKFETVVVFCLFFKNWSGFENCSLLKKQLLCSFSVWQDQEENKISFQERQLLGTKGLHNPS
jgi:hypothetical protein